MKLKQITTGSPIIDSVVATGLVAAIGLLINHVMKIKINFSLFELLSVDLSVPLWVVILLSGISAITITRYIWGPNLKEMLIRRKYRLIFNAKDGRNKEIGFALNGEISIGRNDNEYSWRICWKRLEIFGADGKLYSRFRYDGETDKFYLINGVHNRSLPNQIIEPIKDTVNNWAQLGSR